MPPPRRPRRGPKPDRRRALELLADARKRARDLAGQVARGQDPAAQRAEAKRRDSSTLRALLVEEGPYQRDLERRGIVARKVVLSGLNRGLHRLMSKDVADLTRRDFVSAISALEAVGKPGAASELRKHSGRFLEWCVSTGRASHNVLAGLRRPKRSRAERLKAAANGGRALSDDEIRQLWQAADERIFGTFGTLVRLALLTGAARRTRADRARPRSPRRSHRGSARARQDRRTTRGPVDPADSRGHRR